MGSVSDAFLLDIFTRWSRFYFSPVIIKLLSCSCHLDLDKDIIMNLTTVKYKSRPRSFGLFGFILPLDMLGQFSFWEMELYYRRIILSRVDSQLNLKFLPLVFVLLQSSF